MPQIGQLPGPCCTTSGCIGQTYSVAARSASSAMPQSGQSPAAWLRTSGCIGQVYAPPAPASGFTATAWACECPAWACECSCGAGVPFAIVDAGGSDAVDWAGGLVARYFAGSAMNFSRHFGLQ